MIGLKDTVACSSGSACTTAAVLPSHVLSALGRTEDEIESSLFDLVCAVIKVKKISKTRLCIFSRNIETNSFFLRLIPPEFASVLAHAKKLLARALPSNRRDGLISFYILSIRYWSILAIIMCLSCQLPKS